MLLFLLVFFALVALSTPISIALGITSIVMVLTQTDLKLMVVAQRMFTGIDSFPLMAIPFFILSGHLMNAGGTTQRLITFCNALVGRLRGGLANISIVGNMIMAGISGSSVADASALGSIIIPAMKKEGYDADYAAAVNATASTIGIIIPPSIPMILLGVVASVSIRDLFIGGAVPGVVTGLVLMSISTYIAYKRGYPKHARVSVVEALRAHVLLCACPLHAHRHRRGNRAGNLHPHGSRGDCGGLCDDRGIHDLSGADLGEGPRGSVRDRRADVPWCCW